MTATETTTNVERQERDVGVPWRSSTLLTILAATLMTPMDVPLISPALPEVKAFFNISRSQAGLFITLYALPGILLAPAIGWLADRVGRRYVLSGCLALFGVAGTAIAFTNDFTIALTLRVVQGFAAGSILSALAMTVVGDRYTGRQHDSVMGVTSAMLSLGTAVYPLIGGFLAARAWNAPFLLYGFAIPVAGLVFFTLDDRVTSRDTDETGYLREALRTIPAGRAVALYGVMFLSFALLFGGIYTALPFYLETVFSFDPTTVGLVTSGMLLVTAVVSTQNGRLAARASTAKLITAGFGLYSVGFLGIAVATVPSMLVASLLVFGTGNGLVTPTLFARISALAPDHVRAGVMSLQTTTIGVSQAVGPAVFTLLGGVFSYHLTILGASAGAALLTAVFGLFVLNS